jgi:hypothetical protein
VPSSPVRYSRTVTIKKTVSWNISKEVKDSPRSARAEGAGRLLVPAFIKHGRVERLYQRTPPGIGDRLKTESVCLKISTRKVMRDRKTVEGRRSIDTIQLIKKADLTVNT